MRANNYRGVHQVQIIDERVNKGVRILREGGVCAAGANAKVDEASPDLLKPSIEGTVVSHALAGMQRGGREGTERIFSVSFNAAIGRL